MNRLDSAKKPGRAIGVVLAICVFAASALHMPDATAIQKATDQSDLWWVHTESGWGIQLVQNHNTIFATLFVYGSDNQPTWYTATLPYQGALTWKGTLNKTTGPWFGAAAFDPSAVTATPVGTMTLNAPKVNSATLTYTVDGVQVVKSIQRQLLAYENFEASYAGVVGQEMGTGTGCNPADAFDSTPATILIAQNGTAMTTFITARGDSCSFIGTYGQTGHFGRFAGSYTCGSGPSGTFEFFEMVRTHADFRARTTLTTAAGCTIDGRIIGLEQPLPPQ